MSPELVEEFVSHFDRLRRAGRRTDPDAYAFPDIRGGRIARQRVARMLGEAAARASERVSQRGLPPLPHTTPHTLRRTYVSIALLPARRLWVMGQVGHADSKMTIDVYAQLQQRVKREHGRAFDTLVRQAREQLYDSTSGLPEAAPEPNLGHESGHDATLGEPDGPRGERIGEQESSDLQAARGMARPGLEPVRTASPVMGHGCRHRRRMARPGLEPVRTASPVMGHGCRHRRRMARPGLEPVRTASPVMGHGCRHRRRMARPGLEPVRTASPVMGHGCRHRRRMARPGLEPVRTASPVMGHGCRHRRRMARPGLEPGTPRFSDKTD